MSEPVVAPQSVPVDARLFTADLTRLRGGRCDACGALTFPLRAGCPNCQGQEITEVSLASRGTIWTFTVIHAPPPGYTGHHPYALGVVELEDGIRVTSVITADDLDDLRIGDRVELEPLEVGEAEAREMTFAFRREGSS